MYLKEVVNEYRTKRKCQPRERQGISYDCIPCTFLFQQYTQQYYLISIVDLDQAREKTTRGCQKLDQLQWTEK